MENEGKVHVTVPPDYNGQPINVIIREGEAETIIQPQSWRHNVTIKSIGEYIRKRAFPEDVKDNKAIVLFSVDPKDPYIKYRQDPEYPTLGAELEAHLVKNPELESFGINKDFYFAHSDLKNHVRKYAHTFAEMSEARVFLQKLQNFEAKFETHLKKANDNQGNTEDSVKSAIRFTEGELPKALRLSIPLYKNTPKVDLDLEIQIEKRGNAAVFGFYCLDLEQKMRDTAEEIIYSELEPLREGFVVMEQ